MKFRSFLLFILFSMLFVGCEQQNQQTDIRLQKIVNLLSELGISFHQESQKRHLSGKIVNSFLKSDINCPSEDCPPFVGGLFMKKDEKPDALPEFCSATLIGSSRVLTNAHCIPGDIAKAGSDCGGRVRVVFPQTKDHTRESFHCKRILGVASDFDPNQSGSPDWAVLELNGVSPRKPVVFRRDGIAPKEPVTIYKVDFDSDESMVRGQVVRANCLANNHLESHSFIGPISALFGVSNCNPSLKEGNSGSILLDHKRRLVGLLSFVDLFSPIVSEGRRGGGTHGACIPLDEYHPPEECEFDKDKYSVLSVMYNLWSQLLWDAEFAQKAHKENTEKISSLRFSQTLYKWQEDDVRIDFKKEEPMKASHRYFLHQLLPLIFPSFPECVKQKAENSFTFLLHVYKGEQMIHFERQGDIYWVTLADSTENTFPMSDFFVLEETNVLRFQIPVCK